MEMMVELHLRSGQVVAFDGRVVEVFDAGRPSGRFHLAQLPDLRAVEQADGGQAVALADGSIALAFARGEAPACARLLAAIADARGALDRLDTPDRAVG
jgi:hypothetical protein